MVIILFTYEETEALKCQVTSSGCYGWLVGECVGIRGLHGQSCHCDAMVNHDPMPLGVTFRDKEVEI